MKERKKTVEPFSLWIPHELREKVRWLAYQFHASQSSIIVDILSRNIDDYEKRRRATGREGKQG